MSIASELLAKIESLDTTSLNIKKSSITFNTQKEALEYLSDLQLPTDKEVRINIEVVDRVDEQVLTSSELDHITQVVKE